MKSTIYSSIINLVIILLISGCSKCCNDVDKLKKVAKKTNSEVGVDTIAKEENITQQIPNTDKKTSTTVVNINPKDLEKFLPKKIPGFEMYPPSSGKSYDEQQSWTTASADYSNNKRSNINIAIFDYGLNGYISDKQYFDEIPPDDEEMKSERVILPQGKGYQLWNERERKGLIYVLISERYTIKIEVQNLPIYLNTLRDLLNFINIDNLIEYGNKNMKG